MGDAYTDMSLLVGRETYCELQGFELLGSCTVVFIC